MSESGFLKTRVRRFYSSRETPQNNSLKTKKNFLIVHFSDMSAGAGSPLNPPVTEALFPLPFCLFFFFFFGVATDTFSHSFSLNISRQKGNKNGSLIFIRRRHILQSPPKNFGREHFCRRERPPPPRTQRCVYRVDGVNDCLRRIAGLNSPASPPLREKNPDTSYNSHALRERKGKKQCTEADKQRLRPPK